jgi:hypothetical protein
MLFPVIGRNAYAPQYAPQALAFFARLATQPSDARKKAYADLIGGLVADGIWSLLDALWILAAADSATALKNLVSSSFSLTANGAMTFTANAGYQSDNVATSFLATGYTPSTAGGQLTQNSGSFGAYSLTTDSSAGFFAPIGCIDATNGLFIFPQFSAGSLGGRVNANAGGTNSPNPIPNSQMKGFYTFSRTSSGVVNVYKNGSTLGSIAQTSSGLPTVAMTLFSRNNNGTQDDPWPDQCSAFYIGGGLNAAQVLQLSTRINTYMTVLGINVY